jgi:hypothetical protein
MREMSKVAFLCAIIFRAIFTSIQASLEPWSWRIVRQTVRLTRVGTAS